MMKYASKVTTTLLLLVLLVVGFINGKSVYQSQVDNTIYNTSSIVEKKDINDELLDLSTKGYKNVNIYVQDNKISFDKSNTITELNYALYNVINNSDKTTWNIITNNLVENYEVINNEIVIKDKNVEKVSFSFIYNEIEYHLSLVKYNDKYILRESNIKLVHGSLNSLWYTYFDDLESAVKCSKDNDYIVLYDDINVDKTIDVNKNITIMSKAGNIFTLINNEGYLFNVNNSNITLNNVLINTESFIEGKTNKIVLDNTKVVYKDKLFPKKSTLKNKVSTKDINVFNKASL